MGGRKEWRISDRAAQAGCWLGARTDVEPRKVLGHPRFAQGKVTRRVVVDDARDGEAPQDENRHQARDPVELDLAPRQHKGVGGALVTRSRHLAVSGWRQGEW